MKYKDLCAIMGVAAWTLLVRAPLNQQENKEVSAVWQILLCDFAFLALGLFAFRRHHIHQLQKAFDRQVSRKKLRGGSSELTLRAMTLQAIDADFLSEILQKERIVSLRMQAITLMNDEAAKALGLVLQRAPHLKRIQMGGIPGRWAFDHWLLAVTTLLKGQHPIQSIKIAGNNFREFPSLPAVRALAHALGQDDTVETFHIRHLPRKTRLLFAKHLKNNFALSVFKPAFPFAPKSDYDVFLDITDRNKTHQNLHRCETVHEKMTLLLGRHKRTLEPPPLWFFAAHQIRKRGASKEEVAHVPWLEALITGHPDELVKDYMAWEKEAHALKP